MNFWWVNQNQTYKMEVRGGFLWSPKTNRNSAQNQFYTNMTLVQPGDVVFSFCNTRIQAIGRALGTAETATKPDFGTAGSTWADEGWYVPVQFTELERTIRPKDMIEALIPHLPKKYSPLQTSGDGLQNVYLAAVPTSMAEVLLDALGPVAQQIAGNEIGFSDDQSDEVELESLAGRTDIGPTLKRQLVNSRRGQGVYKANVQLNEKRCRLTGELDPQLLTASHIKPWRDSNDHEKLDGSNGLLMSPHVDRLFDRGLISFRDNGDLMISSKLDPSTLERWGLIKVKNVGPFSPGQCHYLDYHRKSVFKAPVR